MTSTDDGFFQKGRQNLVNTSLDAANLPALDTLKIPMSSRPKMSKMISSVLSTPIDVNHDLNFQTAGMLKTAQNWRGKNPNLAFIDVNVLKSQRSSKVTQNTSGENVTHLGDVTAT